MEFRWLTGIITAVIIAAAAYRAKSLSRDGQIAASVIGALTFGGAGFLGASAMIAFFVSASALSRVGGARKQQVSAAFSKGGRRDSGQVMANGLAAAVFALLYSQSDNPVWAAGIAGSMAAANADTWATELGVLARRSPRLITSWERVTPGTSGGITTLGLLASVLGAALIGLVTLPFLHDWSITAAAVVGGLAASLFDSLLGALVQAMYWCPSCEKETERHPHHICGSETRFHRGLAWVTNDLVNFSATLVGSLTAIGLYLAL